MTDEKFVFEIVTKLQERVRQIEWALNMPKNEPKQVDSVQSGLDSIEKPLEINEIEEAFDTCNYIAKIVVDYRDRLIMYGIEANLAGSLAKDLSGRLWSDVLEDGHA